MAREHDQAMVWVLACRQQPGRSTLNRFSVCSQSMCATSLPVS